MDPAHDQLELDPEDPCDAQIILLEYLRVFETTVQEEQQPPLRYAAGTVKAALRTAVKALRATGQMTDDIGAYLELAYVSLADSSCEDAARLRDEFQLWRSAMRPP